MQTKLQELTEKIYREGINKANEDADKILSDARKEAQSLLDNARKEAQNLLSNAEREAEETRINAMNELQLSGRQAISDIKLKILGLIEAKTIKPETKNALNAQGFIPDILKTIVGNWDPQSGEAVDLEAMLPKDRQSELQGYFNNKIAELLDKELHVSFSEKIKGGFKIGPKDGGYMISFTDEDFENFFQAYLRPKLIELLFGNKQD